MIDRNEPLRETRAVRLATRSRRTFFAGDASFSARWAGSTFVTSAKGARDEGPAPPAWPRRAVSFSPKPKASDGASASGGASASVFACFWLPRLVWSVSFRRTSDSFPPEGAPISTVRARGRERAHVVCGARMCEHR
jgi:hypothetical protein